jgi:hypothetical protein
MNVHVHVIFLGLDLPYEYNRRENALKEQMNPFLSPGDVVLLSGCHDDGVSVDQGGCGLAGGGVMTSAFVASLKSNPCPTYLGDSY